MAKSHRTSTEQQPLSVTHEVAEADHHLPPIDCSPPFMNHQLLSIAHNPGKHNLELSLTGNSGKIPLLKKQPCPRHSQAHTCLATLCKMETGASCINLVSSRRPSSTCSGGIRSNLISCRTVRVLRRRHYCHQGYPLCRKTTTLHKPPPPLYVNTGYSGLLTLW